MAPFLILIYPFAEIYAFYRFMEAYGFLNGVFLVLFSGFLGISILVFQGKAALMGLQNSLNQGKLPANEILHRALIMLGGLLLVVPGIISDVIGLLCILPISRHLLIGYFKMTLMKAMAQGRVGFFRFQQGQTRQSHPQERDATVVDITPLEIIHQNRNDEN